ncbi:MAG TPA: carboxypeptidase-like regulatory domain-containing protein [Bryobacteraceae bacterium]|jgi:hypothetical protein|nr:carboxypeptidase-like regulatory domain-containing protein [Bryobacteraceae bacterium]
MKLALWMAAASLAAGQTQGVVVDSVTGAPLPGAYVSVRSAAQTVTRTDAAGHFTIEGGPVQVARAGYVEAVNVRTDLSGGELIIPLTPAAVIAGKLVDRDGFPDSGARVDLMQYRILNGERRLYSAVLGQATQSNDLGEFRIGSLRPGRYYLRVSGGSAADWDRRYGTQYYGGTAEPKAENRIEVKAGEVHDKTDMILAIYEGVNVSGSIEGLPLPIGGGGSALLHLANAEYDSAHPFVYTLRPDGTFTIKHVTPGKYKLTSQSGAFGEAGSLRAAMPLEVGANDVTGLTLAVHTVKPVDIAGSLTLAGGGTPAPMTVALNGGRTVRSEADGSFVFKGVLPGHYQVQVYPDLSDRGSAWYPQSAILGERDVLRTGFDVDSEPVGTLRITVGPAARMDGKLVGAAGQPVVGVTVCLLSSQDESTAITHSDGTYRSMVRIPGAYRVYLVSDPGQLTDPDYLDAHQNDFPPVRLAAGENPPLVLVKK